MKTLEMIKDWEDSNYKKKYINKSKKINLPHIVYNNGFNVLFESYFIITIKDPLEKSHAFIFSKENLSNEWEKIIEEYDIKEAIRKSENGDKMISLASGKELDIKHFTKEEILGIWIEKI